MVTQQNEVHNGLATTTSGPAKDGAGESEPLEARIARLVGAGQRVLYLGHRPELPGILQERGCQVVTIVPPDTAVERVAACSERVIVGDLDALDLADELGDERFEVVVAADLFGHLGDPEGVLDRLKQLLSPDGRLVASVLNVAHGSVRLALLGGAFPYGESGLLDRANRRFFTRAGLEALFEGAGFEIDRLERETVALDRSEVPYDRQAAPPDVLEALASDAEALTYRFVVVAWPSRGESVAGGARLRALLDEKQRLEHELALLRQRAEGQAEQFAALAAQNDAVASREAELRALLLEAHDQLLRRDDEFEQLQQVVNGLKRAVDERTEWAERMVSEAERRGAIIDEQQAALEALRAELRQMQSSRAWQIAHRARRALGLRR